MDNLPLEIISLIMENILDLHDIMLLRGVCRTFKDIFTADVRHITSSIIVDEGNCLVRFAQILPEISIIFPNLAKITLDIDYKIYRTVTKTPTVLHIPAQIDTLEINCLRRFASAFSNDLLKVIWDSPTPHLIWNERCVGVYCSNPFVRGMRNGGIIDGYVYFKHVAACNNIGLHIVKAKLNVYTNDTMGYLIDHYYYNIMTVFNIYDEMICDRFELHYRFNDFCCEKEKCLEIIAKLRRIEPLNRCNWEIGETMTVISAERRVV